MDNEKFDPKLAAKAMKEGFKEGFTVKRITRGFVKGAIKGLEPIVPGVTAATLILLGIGEDE